MIGKIGLGVLGTALLAGVYVAEQGLVRVRVVEKKPGGDRVNLYVPAAAIPVALRLAPDDSIRRASERAKDLLPALRIACEELARLPDTELVEVRDSREHVRIRTVEGKLEIDVESDREDVRISVPLKLVENIAEQLQERRAAT